MNYTYLVECADKTLYCGWTNDLKKPMEAHNSGQGAKYTRARRPVKLVYYEEFETKGEAMKREAAIKKLSRKEKTALINIPTQWPAPETIGKKEQIPGGKKQGEK